MGFLIALFLFVSTFGGVRHYMQAVAIAQEMYSWDHPTTEIDDVTYVDNAAVAYGVTITAVADSSGNSSYDYMKTAATT